jgi:PAS domain S-box-containing protein
VIGAWSAEAALHGYGLLARHSRDIILFIRREDGRVLEANAAASAAYGLSIDELRTMTVFELSASETRTLVESQLADAEAGGLSFETVHRRKDGTTFPVDVSSQGITIGGTRVLASIVRDISDRKRADAALAERDRYLDTILQTALDGFYAVDLQGRILDVNGAYCAMSGYTRDELRRMKVSDIEVTESSAEVAAHIARIVARGSDRFETQHRRKDGQLIDVESSVTFLPERGGTLLTFIRDITLDKRAREALQRSAKRFRALIEKATDILVLLDAAGCIDFWSPGAAKALGWTQEEVQDVPVANLIHADDRAAWCDAFAEMTKHPGDTVRVLTRQRHRDGTWRLVEVVGRNLVHDEAVGCVVANMRDVTEQRRLEEQVLRSQKLESVARLAGGVAHDFNNLLTVILTCAETLRDVVSAGKIPTLEDVEEIDAAAQRGRDLTRQLLAFARKQVIAPLPLDLAEIVRGSEKLLRRLLGEDVRLVVDSAQELWHVHCDPGQIEQVILNLAINARDAMPSGGTLVIATSNVTLQDSAPRLSGLSNVAAGDYVRLVVQDSGTGMSHEIQARIFEPFFTTKEVGKGTGLGLATVYGIVKQSGGHIRVESELGCGSRFEVWLPRTTDRLLPRPTAVAASKEHGTETVLLVEDDPRIRRNVARALGGCGYRVIVAADGADALDASSRDGPPPELVITDVVMPGMDGRTLAGELRRRYPGLRVLYVSGYANDALAERGVIESGTQFLAKPFTAASLLERVRALLADREGLALPHADRA